MNKKIGMIIINCMLIASMANRAYGRGHGGHIEEPDMGSLNSAQKKNLFPDHLILPATTFLKA